MSCVIRMKSKNKLPPDNANDINRSELRLSGLRFTNLTAGLECLGLPAYAGSVMFDL